MIKFEAVTENTSALADAARQLFREYASESEVRQALHGFDDELVSLPGEYASPRGGLILLTFRGDAVACGAFRRVEDGVCELKRTYVLPDLRGMGFGRMITEELLRRASASGYKRARLDILSSISSASELYRSMGFGETSRETHADGTTLVYMDREVW
ncbi:N-acetyltransferase [soil metagenome]